MRTIFGLAIFAFSIWLPINTIIYLFSNNSIDEVKNLRIGKAISYSVILLGAKGMGENYEKKLIERGDMIANQAKKDGIDTDAKFYDAITSNKRSSGTTIEKTNSVSGDGVTIDEVTVTTNYDDGILKFRFYVFDKEFTKPLSAEIMIIESLELLKSDGGVVRSLHKTDNPFITSIAMANFSASRNEMPFSEILKMAATKNPSFGLPNS